MPCTALTSAVAKFVNGTRPRDWLDRIPPISVGEFGWASVGGGKSDFVVLLNLSERFFNTLWVYRCDDAGGLDIQEIDGWANMGPLNKMVRDLNSHGEDELIIPTELAWPPGSWT